MSVTKKGGIPLAVFWEERCARLVAEERARGLEALVEILREGFAPARPPAYLRDPSDWRRIVSDEPISRGRGFAVSGKAAMASAQADAPEPVLTPLGESLRKQMAEAEAEREKTPPILWLGGKVAEAAAPAAAPTT